MRFFSIRPVFEVERTTKCWNVDVVSLSFKIQEVGTGIRAIVAVSQPIRTHPIHAMFVKTIATKSKQRIFGGSSLKDEKKDVKEEGRCQLSRHFALLGIFGHCLVDLQCDRLLSKTIEKSS